jgi:hypothetical protein
MNLVGALLGEAGFGNTGDMLADESVYGGRTGGMEFGFSAWPVVRLGRAVFAVRQHEKQLGHVVAALAREVNP